MLVAGLGLLISESMQLAKMYHHILLTANQFDYKHDFFDFTINFSVTINMLLIFKEI